jgi:hypothetical protein
MSLVKRRARHIITNLASRERGKQALPLIREHNMARLAASLCPTVTIPASALKSAARKQ